MMSETTSETRASIKTTDVKVGDQIGRQMGADGPVMWLTVTDVDEEENIIYCNLWMFDRLTGAEIDHDLQWGPEYGRTGSYIRLIKQGPEAS